jgi:hypothetical protein
MALRRTASILAAAVVMALAGHSRVSACDDGYICAAGSPWLSVNSLSLRLREPATGRSETWDFSTPEENSFVVDFVLHRQQQTVVGKIILVGGRVMLLKGIPADPGDELFALDASKVMFTLVVNVLTQAFPKGPQGLNGKVTADVAEAKRSIMIGTMTDSFWFPAPWSVKGSLERLSSEAIAYALFFRSARFGNDEKSGINLVGEWKNTVPPPKLDSAMSLEGWSVYSLGPMSRVSGTTSYLWYGAKPLSLPVRTLGELKDYMVTHDLRHVVEPP